MVDAVGMCLACDRVLVRRHGRARWAPEVVAGVIAMLVSEDGASFYAQTSEKKEFDNAKAVFQRASNYEGARKQFVVAN